MSVILFIRSSVRYYKRPCFVRCAVPAPFHAPVRAMRRAAPVWRCGMAVIRMLLSILIGLDWMSLVLSHRDLSSPNSLDLCTAKNVRCEEPRRRLVCKAQSLRQLYFRPFGLLARLRFGTTVMWYKTHNNSWWCMVSGAMFDLSSMLGASTVSKSTGRDAFFRAWQQRRETTCKNTLISWSSFEKCKSPVLRIQFFCFENSTLLFWKANKILSTLIQQSFFLLM